MSQLMAAKHEAFCQAYARGPHAGSLSDAYAAAGYASDRSNAARLARQPHIAKRIAELRAENDGIEAAALAQATAALALDKQMVLAELMKIGFANVFDYMDVDDDDELQVDLTRLERDKGAAVRDLAVEFEETPAGARKVARIRIQLFDKRLALMDLGRHLGLTFGRAVEAKGRAATFATPGAARAAEYHMAYEQMTGAEREETYVRNVAQLADAGVDMADLHARAMAARRKPDAPTMRLRDFEDMYRDEQAEAAAWRAPLPAIAPADTS